MPFCSEEQSSGNVHTSSHRTQPPSHMADLWKASHGCKDKKQVFSLLFKKKKKTVYFRRFCK
jgi:hypothetical protein